MPDLNTIVQRMIDADEPEEAIASVIQHFQKVNPPKPQPAPRPVQKIAPTEEDTFMGGFTKSLFGGEALGAGLQGALGFAKGAIADIPSTIIGGAKDALDMKLNPGMTALRMSEGIKQIPGVVERAGSDPEPFGRLMGQLTGQPAVMHGLGVGANALRNPVASILEGTGGFVAKHQPITGLAPRIVQPRTLRLVERGIGKGVERLGQAIRKEPQPLPYGEVDLETPVDTIPVKPAPGPSSRYRSKPIEPNDRRPPRGGAPVLNKQKVPTIEEQFATILEEGRNEAPDLKSTELANDLREFETSFPSTRADHTLQNRPEGARLNKVKGPSTEEQMAAAIQEVRDSFAQAQDPTTQLPPPDYSLGAGSPPQQPRVSVAAPKSRFKSKEPKAPKAKAEPPKEEFKPATDPKEIVNTETGEIVDDVADAFNAGETGTTLPDDVKALIREKVRGKKGKGKWSINLKEKLGNFMKEESGEFDPDFWRREADPVDIGSIDEPVDLTKAVQALEAPPVTNRRMFELSAQRGAEEAAARRPQSAFSNPAGLHEFQPDMAYLPDEFAQADVPPMQSPVENRFDPRVAPGGVASDIFEGASPTFSQRLKDFLMLDDERGMVGKDIGSKSAFKQKMNEKFAQEQQKIREGEPKLKVETPDEIPDEPKPKLVKPTGEKVAPKSKPIGPKGKSVRIHDPNGEHLGDVEILPKDVEAILEATGRPKDDINADLVSKEMYKHRLEEILEDHGYSPDDLPRMKITEMDNRVKKVQSTAEPKPEPVREPEPDYAELKPDEAFAPGGDTKEISNIASRLHARNASDTSYKQLLPSNLRFALKSGESYKQRLQTLLEGSRDWTDGDIAALRRQIAAEEAEFAKGIDSAKAEAPKPKVEPVPIQPFEESQLPKLRLRDLKSEDFKTRLGPRLRGLLGQTRRPDPWVRPKPKRKSTKKS
jgi:hypothetical protein